MGRRDNKGTDAPDGRRSGRNTTFSTEAYRDDEEASVTGSNTSDDPRERTGGAAVVDPHLDGFHQPTAMFDKGEFLGELAELVDGGPETRAKVEAEGAPPLGCRLIIVAGPDLGLEWGFKAKEIIIGRDEDCELVMSDIAVSRRHARIAFEDDHFVLTDLGSGNGTYLNGVRVQQERLSPGDEIIVGERTLRFVELNEAPSTKAAHPVQAGLHSPEVADVPDPSGHYEPVPAHANVDASVADARAPSLSSRDLPDLDDGPAGSGFALKRLLVGLAVVAGVAAASAAGWWVYQRYFAGETPAERALRAKREFLQGVELVKQLRCGDASILFSRVLRAAPNHPRAPDYLEHCERQLAHWQHVARAREMAAARRYIEAMDRLKRVPPDSDYAAVAARDRQVYARSIAYALLDEARDAFDAREIDTALERVDRALELAPDLADAHELRRRIADATATPKRRPRPRPTFSVPKPLRRAVALYQNGRVGAAIDAAEAVGGDQARVWVQRMKALKKLLAEATVAHRKKAAGALLRVCPEALAIDKKLTDSEGQVHQKLSKYYADGLYLKGIEALQSADDVSAFRLLTRAVKVRPDHRLAVTRLAELDGKAREIYYEGYVLKEQDKAETRRIFRRLTQMTSASNPYHKLASDWLRANR